MSVTVLYALGSVILVGLVSFVGVFTLSLKRDLIKRIVFFLLALAVGALFGDVFLHIIPELAEGGIIDGAGLYICLGILAFFILEKFFRWHHSHSGVEEGETEADHAGHTKHLAYLNLTADGLHNFIDGLFIGSSYLISIEVGIATTIAVILHEIPQEIGDFGLLIHAGFSRARALLLNFGSACAAILGAITALVVGASAEGFLNVMLPLTAGSLLYVAGSDLVPELHKVHDIKRSLLQLGGMIAGFLAMYLLLFLE